MPLRIWPLLFALSIKTVGFASRMERYTLAHPRRHERRGVPRMALAGPIWLDRPLHFQPERFNANLCTPRTNSMADR
jgi:hypothetical protein